MKCPKCKGCGKTDVDDGIFTIYGYDCDYCLGTGYIEPMTNEEYIRSCSVEELASVIADFYLLGYTHGRNGTDIESRQEWMKWLKEKHE